MRVQEPQEGPAEEAGDEEVVVVVRDDHVGEAGGFRRLDVAVEGPEDPGHKVGGRGEEDQKGQGGEDEESGPRLQKRLNHGSTAGERSGGGGLDDGGDARSISCWAAVDKVRQIEKPTTGAAYPADSWKWKSKEKTYVYVYIYSTDARGRGVRKTKICTLKEHAGELWFTASPESQPGKRCASRGATAEVRTAGQVRESATLIYPRHETGRAAPVNTGSTVHDSSAPDE